MDHQHKYEREDVGLEPSRCNYRFHAKPFKASLVFVCECGSRVCALCVEVYGQSQAKECPVCPHPVKVHDGVGCTASVDGSMCVCPIAQDMPGSPLTKGTLWKEPDIGQQAQEAEQHGD